MASMLAPSRRGRLRPAVSLAAVAVALALGHDLETARAGTPDRLAANPAAPGEAAAFLAESEVAMNRMMTGMAVQPTGDVDRDFVAMMVPHHQGAIDMARAVLRHGRNEQIRRLAQEIVVTQQQEIATMRLAVGDALPPSTASPTNPADDAEMHRHPMPMK